MKRIFLGIISIIILCQGLSWSRPVDVHPNVPPPPPRNVPAEVHRNVPPPPPARCIYDYPIPYVTLFDDYYPFIDAPEPEQAAQPAQPGPQYQVINGYASGMPYVTSTDMAYQNFSAQIQPLMKEGVTKGEITDILGQPFLTGNKGDSEVWIYPNQPFITILNTQIAEGKYQKHLDNEDMSNYNYQPPDYFSWNNKPYFLIFIFKASGSAGGYIDQDNYKKLKAQTGNEKLPGF